MSQAYVYSIADDTANGVVNTDTLNQEIFDSTILIAVLSIVTVGDVLTITFKGNLSTQEESLLDTIVSNHEGLEINTPDLITVQGFENATPINKAIPVAVFKPEYQSFARATHDFTNKCTWYTDSVRVLNETANPISLVLFGLANTNIIDVVNGVINRQDTLQQYRVVVKVNGVEVTSGFTINHVTGQITFAVALLVTDVVTVDYSYATTSRWVIAPSSGKTLIINHSELQFSTDVQVTRPLRFEIWVYNPMDLPNKFIYEAVQYNSMKDIIQEANLGQGLIPQVADLPTDIHVFPFNYVTVKPMGHSIGAELVIKTLDDEPIGGSYGTATFYLTSKDEDAS